MIPSRVSTFLLSPEHEELRRALRRFAEEQVAPYAAEADERSEYPWKSFEGYRQSGFLGIPYPAEHGGEGADGVAYAMLVEEVARVCASSALFVFISRLACAPIIANGSAELAARVVRKVASGEWQGSYCLSEPSAGSDLGAMSTRAVRDGDHYVLTGRKAWISNAGVSDFYTVFAVSDPDAAPRRGISAFVVERDTPGLSVGKLESKMGMRGSPTGEVLLEDVVVPVENRIGEENEALRYAFEALDGSRPIVGAQAIGIAQGALDVASRYVKERRQFDTAIAEFQGVQFMLADMATRVEAARLLVYRACAMGDAGSPGLSKAASMAKLFATDTAMAVTTDSVQLLGGAGYTRDFPVERMMRDAKATQIYEGTNQIQRIVIARRLLDEVPS
jgi:alkylation response protein AidB-like acyl-CoA dehydrogenase